MPYIPAPHRRELDPLIAALAQRLVQEADQIPGDAAFAGLLHYTCTCLALKVIQLRFGRLRYWLLALLTGTFHHIADELYRRLGAPYEDRQLAVHGDVELYDEVLRESVK